MWGQGTRIRGDGMTGLRSVLGAAALSFVLGGCGAAYVSPTVTSQAAGLDVRVVPITGQSVHLANRLPYAPRSLPAIFRQTAGGGSSAVGLGALPPIPEDRQGAPTGEITLRVPPQPDGGPYRIGVGDTLRVSTRSTLEAPQPLDGVPSPEELRQTYTVRDDGTVAIPELGAIPAAGRPVDQIEAAIFQRMVEADMDPSFSVEVSGFNSQRVSVGGGVGRPSVLPLGPTDLTLAEALTQAGGVAIDDTAFGVIRIYRDGTLYQVPLEDFRARGDLQTLPLTNGDAVYVDSTYDLDRALAYYESQINVIALRQASRAQALAQLQAEVGLRRAALEEARTNFQSRAALGGEDRDYVYLTGEVATQARWPLPYEQQASLADALFDGGGFRAETGNPSQIYVLRAAADPDAPDTVTAWHLDAANAINFTLAPQFQLRPNDIIFVEEQPITRWNRSIQQLLPTLITTASATQ